VNYHRKHGEAAQRFAERRRREDEAPRLITEIPELRSLRLDVDEHTKDGIVSSEPAHIRRVVVEHAPALFILPCGDGRCKDGGHDITRTVLQALRSHQTRFEGEDACGGSQGSGQCGRVLHYIGTASFDGGEGT
jgi:hypothetical protein